jgi:predicted nucleic acid-binding Zn ribbon protein
MRRSTIQPIAEVLNDYLKNVDLDKKIKEARIINQWEDIIGRNVARATKHIYIKNKTLYLSFNSSVIRAEIFMIREGLISKINEQAGETIIEQIELY